MVDMNTFLRRADVEALLNAKIAGAADKVERTLNKQAKSADSMTPAQMSAMAKDIVDHMAAIGALQVALKHLKFCEQFTLTPGQTFDDGPAPHLVNREGTIATIK